MRRLIAWLAAATSLGAAEMKLVPAAEWEQKDPATGIALRVRTAAFLLAASEVSQQEYEALAGRNPAHYRGPRRPVESVSWWDAVRYCNLLSLREGLEPCYDLSSGACDRARSGYRLPTEAEWDAAQGRRPLPKGEAAARLAWLGPAETRDIGPLLRLVRETGTRDTAGLAPGPHGHYDLIGNVWEWCDDWYNANPHPAGTALAATERLIKGGSFASPPGGLGSYRSSLAPERVSRFTGFRVARNAPAAPPAPLAADRFFEPFDRRPKGFKTATGSLAPLVSAGATRERWTGELRPALLARWRKLLGAPALAPSLPEARLLRSFDGPDFTARLLELRTEPDSWERVHITVPAGPAARPRPVVVVPYYDVDVPAGRNLGGRRWMEPSVRSFALAAAQRGYISVAVRWFGESYGERYNEAVANLALRHPGVSGLGKWVWDAGRLLDYLGTLPEVDPARIGIFGHSLGGKMSLYAAALDERIAAVVFSEGGIGLEFSNYDDFWYFGLPIRGRPPGTDQHELIALTAPRPFLLIAGESADADRSWHYVNAARAVYGLFGDPRRAGLFNHRTGHSPTAESVQLAFDWLDRFLGR